MSFEASFSIPFGIQSSEKMDSQKSARVVVIDLMSRFVDSLLFCFALKAHFHLTAERQSVDFVLFCPSSLCHEGRTLVREIEEADTDV